MFIDEYFSRSEVRQRLLETYRADLAKLKQMMRKHYSQSVEARDSLFYQRIVEAQNTLIEKVGNDRSAFRPLDIPTAQELMAAIETAAMTESLK